MNTLALFLFTLLLTLSDAHEWPEFETSNDAVVHTAFVQTGDELHYFSETTQKEKDLFSGGTESKLDTIAVNDANVKKSLQITPSTLDFGATSIGEASVGVLKICNGDKNGIRLDGILGNSLFLHSSFLKTNLLKSSDCTDVTLAFLAHQPGARKGPFLVHTSDGVYSIETGGVANSNIFRVHPFMGAKIPVNGTMTRQLTIHNPFPFDLRISDIASTGGGLFVQLPHGLDPSTNSPGALWDIHPFESKHIANLVIVGKEELNTTAFAVIRMELMKEEGPQQLKPFYFGMPFEVSSAHGIYTDKDILDFGILKFGERSEPQVFSAYSTLGKYKELEMKRVMMDPEETAAVYLEYASHPPIVLHSPRVSVPGSSTPIVKVQIDSSWFPISHTKASFERYNGRITAVGKNGMNVSVAYTVGVYTGSLFLEGDDGCLHSALAANSRRSIRIRSKMPFPVAIYNISLPVEATNHFTLRLFSRLVELSPGEVAPVFLLKYNRKAPKGFTSHVIVHTNITTFHLPIHVFDGKVEINLHSPQQTSFDFGVIERNDSRTIRFEVRNPNPSSVSLLNLRLPYPEVTRLFFVANYPITKENRDLVYSRNEDRKEIRMGMDLSIPPRSKTFFDLFLRVKGNQEMLGDFVLQTDYETRLFPILYEISKGRLLAIPSTLRFGPSHPGKVSYRTLQLFNSFDEDMIVTDMRTPNGESLVHLEGLPLPPGSAPLLRSGRFTNLGRVVMKPPLDCSHDYCYLGLKLPTPASLPSNLGEASLSDGQWFTHGLTLPTNLADIDAYLYRKARGKLDQLVEKGRTLVNTSIVLHTTKAKHMHIPVTTELVWPRLLTRTSIHFPLTAVGNFTIVNLTLANPTSEPIVVQLIPLVIYPDAEALVDSFRQHLASPLTDHVEMNETLMFSLRDTELFTLRPESPIPQLREELEKALGMSVPRFTLSAILQPHMKMRIRLGFLPSDYTLKSSLLIIRNNLTMIEPVVIYGKGARIGVEVEGVAARGRKPLLFEIRHDHLDDCDNPKRLLHRLVTTLTVRRPFLVVNTGEVPFTVVNMSINNMPCENRGFKILNCFPFRLQPNESYSLDVAYTPDFLSSTNEADLQLYMHMNGSAWMFPLAATVPSDMLSRCHAALPRPPFEHVMYYCCCMALVFCLICILACSYLEGDRAVICAIRSHYASATTVFDLNAPTVEGQWTIVWPPSPPTELRAEMDAPLHTKMLYQAANCVLWLVHHVWKLSLMWRKETRGEERGRGRTRKAKKKNSHANIQMEQRREEERLQYTERKMDGEEGKGRKSRDYVEEREDVMDDVNGKNEDEGEMDVVINTVTLRTDEKEEESSHVSTHEDERRTKKNKKKSGKSEAEEDKREKEEKRKEKEKMEEERKKKEKERRKREEEERMRKAEEEKKKRKEEMRKKKEKENEKRMERENEEKMNEKKEDEEDVRTNESLLSNGHNEWVEDSTIAPKTNGVLTSKISTRSLESFSRPPSSTEERVSTDSESPEWDDVVTGGTNGDEEMSAIVDETAKLKWSRESSVERNQANESGGISAIGSEKKRREEEQQRARDREQLGLELMKGDWLPQMHLPELDVLTPQWSQWPTLPPSSTLSPGPPPGLEESSIPPLFPSLPLTPTPFSSLFSGEHFAPWGEPGTSTGWEPILGHAPPPSKPKKE